MWIADAACELSIITCSIGCNVPRSDCRLTLWCAANTLVPDTFLVSRSGAQSIPGEGTMAYTINVGSIRCHILSDGLHYVDGGGFFGLIPRVLWEGVIAPDAQNLVPCD